MDSKFGHPSFAFGAILLALSACSSTSSSDNSNEPVASDANSQPVTVDTNLTQIIADKFLTGNPMAGRNIPDISSKEAQLGMRLFFSKSLGGDWDSACVSCHHPSLGGGDDLSFPVGVGATSPDLLGPGRAHDNNAPHYDGGPPVPRNAPSTFNVAAWDSVMFHDGRVESIGKTSGKNGDDGQGIRTPETAFGTPDPVAGQKPISSTSPLSDYFARGNERLRKRRL